MSLPAIKHRLLSGFSIAGALFAAFFFMPDGGIPFVLAALAEIGGAWLIWQSVRENRGWLFALLGILALGAYGFIAALQPDANFGRVLAAYGGVFIAGSLAWGIVVDRFQPTIWDYVGSAIALVGAAIIILAPHVAATASTAD